MKRLKSANARGILTYQWFGKYFSFFATCQGKSPIRNEEKYPADHQFFTQLPRWW